MRVVERLLREKEVGIDRVERLQGYDRGPGANILTNIDDTHAEVACKRRPQRLFIHDGLLLGDLSLGVLQVRGRVG